MEPARRGQMNRGAFVTADRPERQADVTIDGSECCRKALNRTGAEMRLEERCSQPSSRLAVGEETDFGADAQCGDPERIVRNRGKPPVGESWRDGGSLFPPPELGSDEREERPEGGEDLESRAEPGKLIDDLIEIASISSDQVLLNDVIRMGNRCAGSLPCSNASRARSAALSREPVAMAS